MRRFIAAERWKATRRMYCFTQQLVKNILLIKKLLESQKGTNGRKKPNHKHLLCKKCLNYILLGTIPMHLPLLIPWATDQCWRKVTRPNKYFGDHICHSSINIHLLIFKTMHFKIWLTSNPKIFCWLKLNTVTILFCVTVFAFKTLEQRSIFD